MSAQDLLDKLYNLDNLLKIQIDIPPSEWEILRNEKPKGEWGYKGARYNWHKTNSVTISTRDFQNRTFQNVGMVKKSFMGSKDEIKPSFRLDFTKYKGSNEDEILKLIGTKTLVLNNCKQDPSYLRQPLGYRILREAGVPAFRCNLATVTINNKPMGIFVNIEAFRKTFLEHKFGNTKGNAYEIEYRQDIILETWRYPVKDIGTPSFEGYSDYDNEKDIKLVAEKIEDGDWNAVKRVVDIDAFIKLYAMESLLKHWDGFTGQINNTFAYNDIAAVENPGLNDIKFKFVPSGIDQILRVEDEFQVKNGPTLARMALDNDETWSKFYKQVQTYIGAKPLSREFYEVQLDRLASVLKQSGVVDQRDIRNSVDELTDQLEGVKKQAKQWLDTN